MLDAGRLLVRPLERIASMLRRFSSLPGGLALALAALLPATGASAFAVGTQDEAVIEPPVAHPDETPCTVALATGAVFGANPVSFDFAPPAACPGPWATVVLTLDISLDAGIQFDRSGQLFLGGVPLWFGTTAEPTPSVSPSWHVERDVTDYTALFKGSQTGSLEIANFTSAVDTSVITASAALLFYPATPAAPAPKTADIVLPLPAGGGIATLNTGTDTLAATLNLPTNILAATLDLYLQSQANDEFWYTCVPTALANELESCGNGALREGEVSVDGVAAGVTPIYPWIFTGGIDPFLWTPIPGVQTLSFTPARADLSPFAGVLSDANPHTVAVSVFGADQHFSATGALRLFLDPKAAKVSGRIIANTLAATPVPNIVQNVTNQNGTISATIDTSDERSFTIAGTVTGSTGEIVNTLTQTSKFRNNQQFQVSATNFVQNIQQTTDIFVNKTSVGPAGVTTENTEFHYPLSVDISEATTSTGGFTQTTSIDQKFSQNTLAFGPVVGSFPFLPSTLSNEISTTDTLLFDQNGNLTGNQDQSETATFQTENPCFHRVLKAVANILTEARTGCQN
jgi:hypothetical protein